MWLVPFAAAQAADCPIGFRWNEPLRACVQGAERDGARDGPWTLAEPDGTVRVVGTFDAGAPVGLWQEWTPDGALLRVTRYGVDGGAAAGTGPDTSGWVAFEGPGVTEAVRPLACDPGASRREEEVARQLVEYCVTPDLTLAGELRAWDLGGTLAGLRRAPFRGELRRWGRYREGRKDGPWSERQRDGVRVEAWEEGIRVDVARVEPGATGPGAAEPPSVGPPPPPFAPPLAAARPLPWGPRCPRSRAWRPLDLAVAAPTSPGIAGTADGALLLLDGAAPVARVDTCKAAAGPPGQAVPVETSGGTLSAAKVAYPYAYGRFDDAVLEVGGARWQLPAAGAPSVRRSAARVVLPDRVVVWGGYGPPADFLGDGASFDFTTGRWSALPVVGAPSPRADPSVAGDGRHVVVWGGDTRQGPTPLRHLDDGAVLHLETLQWSSIPGGGPGPRLRPTWILADEGALLVGGLRHDNTVADDVWLLAFQPTAWTRLDLDGAELRARPTADGRLLLWSGSTFRVLDPATGELALLPALEGNWRAVGFDGHSVVVWGRSHVVREGSDCPERTSPDEPVCDPIPPEVRFDPVAFVLPLPR